MMSHEQIDEENVVERYVLGRLAKEEQEGFEDHFADCPRCLEAVELAQELRAGLRAQAEDEDRVRPAVEAGAEVVEFPESLHPAPAAPEADRPRDDSRSQWLRWAAVVLVALLPSWWLSQRNAELQRRVERLESPFQATPHAVLELQRATSNTLPRVVPRSDEIWIHLAVDLGDLGGSGAEPVAGITASLLDAEGRLLWSRNDLLPPSRGPLTLILPRRWLDPGLYRLELGLQAEDRRDRVEPAGRFDFEVVPTP